MDCYRKELEVYFESGLWVLVEDDKPETWPNEESHVTVFPVVQYNKTTTKVRPVLDCRLFNEKFPVATSLSGAIREKVSELKMIPSGFTHVLLVDFRRAFYSIRLCNRKLGIYLGHGKTDMTDRMAFGLSVGPAALQVAVSLMLTNIIAAHPKVKTFVSIDDLLIVGKDEKSTNIFLHALLKETERFGFQAPSNKIERILPEQEFKWLGLVLKVVDDGRFLVKGKPVVLSNRRAKRDIFTKTGGYLRITGHLEESLATVLADKAKSITAKATSEWDRFSPESVQKEVCKYLNSFREVCKPFLEFLPLYFIPGRVIQLTSDASDKGYAGILTSEEKILDTWAAQIVN